VLKKENIKTNWDFTIIMREISILALISHKNIVQMLEVIETHNNIYIFTEYVPNSLLNYV
jgi:serine/threonine protein kinase